MNASVREIYEAIEAMSTATVTVRYDGPILANHRMDVADLAPALLGISELCKIASTRFNGDRAAVKVLIGTDVRHQCFQVDLHVVQSLWDQAKNILDNSDISSAKDLLEWIGLIGGIGGTTAGGVLGAFGLLKWLRGRKIESAESVVQDGRKVVRVTIQGDNNSVVFVHPQALELLRDETALSNAKRAIQPVLQEGYDKLEFQSPGGKVERIAKPEAEAISRTTVADVDPSAKDRLQTLTTWISVYAPVYDLNAREWQFKFGNAHESMDISETDIAAMAMKRGGAMVDDAFRVELELTQELKQSGPITNHYRIKKVLEFKPAGAPFQT